MPYISSIRSLFTFQNDPFMDILRHRTPRAMRLCMSSSTRAFSMPRYFEISLLLTKGSMMQWQSTSFSSESVDGSSGGASSNLPRKNVTTSESPMTSIFGGKAP